MAGRQHAGLGSWSRSWYAASCAARSCSFGGGVFTQLDGAGSICSSLQQQQQMPPRLQQLRAAVFPGEEHCQEEWL